MKEKFFLALVGVSFSFSAHAEQRFELQSTIVGNKELPKVSYVIPWKTAKPGKFSEKDFSSVLDKEFSALERIVLQREIFYYELGK